MAAQEWQRTARRNRIYKISDLRRFSGFRITSEPRDQSQISEIDLRSACMSLPHSGGPFCAVPIGCRKKRNGKAKETKFLPHVKGNGARMESPLMLGTHTEKIAAGRSGSPVLAQRRFFRESNQLHLPSGAMQACVKKKNRPNGNQAKRPPLLF